jgi:hypothetical protein
LCAVVCLGSGAIPCGGNRRHTAAAQGHAFGVGGRKCGRAAQQADRRAARIDSATSSTPPPSECAPKRPLEGGDGDGQLDLVHWNTGGSERGRKASPQKGSLGALFCEPVNLQQIYKLTCAPCGAVGRARPPAHSSRPLAAAANKTLASITESGRGRAICSATGVELVGWPTSSAAGRWAVRAHAVRWARSQRP